MPSLFLARTYGEAESLLAEARDYLAFCVRTAHAAVPPERKLHFALESSRLTARLVNLMAWLLLQRAVHAGELSRQAALAEAPELSRRAGILANPSGEGLPLAMQELLQRSHRLYVRVARLDAMARERVQSDP
ncbi:MAG: DUF1465 family protein [Alphaproteobacteria bacterium]|nr:DUF1465 family protein [Alphaproteobacteria bacterium]